MNWPSTLLDGFAGAFLGAVIGGVVAFAVARWLLNREAEARRESELQTRADREEDLRLAAVRHHEQMEAAQARHELEMAAAREQHERERNDAQLRHQAELEAAQERQREARRHDVGQDFLIALNELAQRALAGDARGASDALTRLGVLVATFSYVIDNEYIDDWRSDNMKRLASAFRQFLESSDTKALSDQISGMIAQAGLWIELPQAQPIRWDDDSPPR
ncbi:hypothetical protein [Microbispora sp. KK1-11]|uniref:hypothetical protein n=1 Tax=Microbispora sp. KK1-11 TaxID=2053005 RepID=UPI001159868F|nr:hypothetical protein [Microbispora sp. KK1-11]TQS29144.1 hypothetical protein FLW16_12425 [Microbispora sp. KK1-11]